MKYLLFLQGLREAAPSFINEGILFFSEFMGGTGAMAVMALVYWCICKRAGSFMLLNFSGAYMMNQTLKNIFCVQRPFIRDTRLQPYKQASGYSFPSGHTMLGTAVYSSAAVWQSKRKWVVALCIVCTLLTAFGRNWIGVHTPQDVIVGMLVSLAVVYCQFRMLKWLEEHPEKDVFVLLAAILWSGVLLFFVSGSEKVVGIFLGTYIGWFVERRFIRFSVAEKISCRIWHYVIGMIVVLAFYKGLLPLVASPFNENVQTLIINFGIFFIVIAGWPAVLRFIECKKQNGSNK